MSDPKRRAEWVKTAAKGSALERLRVRQMIELSGQERLTAMVDELAQLVITEIRILGAKKYDRIRRGTVISIQISYVFSIFVVLLLLWRGGQILALFIRPDDPLREEILSAGMSFVRVVCPFYLMVCLKTVFDGALRGTGAMLPFLCSTISDVIVRLAVGGIFSQHWGLTGVWYVWPAAWLVGTGISVVSYMKLQKR